MTTSAPLGFSSSEPTLDAVYELAVGGIPASELHVLSFHGHEEMNALYAFEIVFWSRGGDEAHLESTLLGAPVTLSMHLPGAARHVHGIAASVTLEGKHEGGRHAFKMHVVPRLWLLGKRVDSRIFQDKTVRDIVDAVLEEHGVARTWNLLSTYPIRQYCVQYGESDLHFVTRILAEEGIFFSFAHPEGDAATEVVELADASESYLPIEGEHALVYRHQSGDGAMKAEENQVLDFRLRTRIEPSAVAMRDYDFRRPLLDLTSQASRDAALQNPPKRPLEVYDHHGEYEETDADTNNARTILEQLRAGTREAHGTSVCRRLLPARRFDLTEHEIEKLNTAWVVTRVEHKGVAAESVKRGARIYENHFRVAPAEVAFRPPRPERVTKQVIESAIVVGPEGQEIFTDTFGRVKVQFHWDREGKRNAYSSCWMRVMQAWAGTGWGFQFIPRIGMEVVVSFLGGDLDRPVVMGCLYNAVNPVPHGLPVNAARSGIRTHSTPNGGGWNEIAFDDRAGQEQLFVHAQRNLDEEVGLDRSEKVAQDATETIGRDLRTEVGQHRVDATGGDHRVIVNGGRNTRVASHDGLDVRGSRTTDVAEADRAHVGGASVLDVGGDRSVTIGGGDELFVRGSSSTVVNGEDTRVVWAKSRTILHDSASVNVTGALTLGIGSSVAPAAAEGRISGDLTLKGGGAIDLSADKAIRLRVGRTLVTIASDEVSIDADKITLRAKSISGKSDKTSLTMEDAVEIAGKTVKIFSEDKAILELDKDAKLDGQVVKIKPGLAAEQKKAEERDAQAKGLPTIKVHLFDRKGKPIANAPYEVTFFGYHDVGTAADGTVDVPAFPDVDKAHLRWGRPKDKRENTKDPETYEFEMDVFLIAEHADEEEALRRKLHNLGHQGSELYEAVHKVQAALGVARSGLAPEVQGEVESRHTDIKPVDIDAAKGA